MRRTSSKPMRGSTSTECWNVYALWFLSDSRLATVVLSRTSVMTSSMSAYIASTSV
jgi:hypothetical protein